MIFLALKCSVTDDRKEERVGKISWVWIAIPLWLICVVGIVYDVWVIYTGHADRISLYGPAGGIFAEIARRYSKL